MDYGGAAFPGQFWTTSDSDQPSYYPGMSLRDYFAGQALAALIARRQSPVARSMMPQIFLAMAEEAYGHADAMLIERKRSGQAE